MSHEQLEPLVLVRFKLLSDQVRLWHGRQVRPGGSVLVKTDEISVASCTITLDTRPGDSTEYQR
jgi:hypothetical protein